MTQITSNGTAAMSIQRGQKPWILVGEHLYSYLVRDETFVEREGYRVQTYSSLKDLQQLGRKGPDLLIVDIEHIQESLFDFGELPDLLPGVSHIILLAPATISQQLREPAQTMMAEVLFKPINSQHILATTRRLLGLAHRAFPRIPAQLPVLYGRNRSQLQAGCTSNISTGGVFIETKHPLPENEQVLIKLELPTASAPVICYGIISWKNDPQQPSDPDMPPGMGVQFLQLELPELKAIREFISLYEDTTS